MERLTKRITEATIELSANANPIQYNGSPQRVHRKHQFWNVFNRLCEYEDAEEQGLLLRLPCKVGDRVWYEDKNSTWLIGVHQYQITNVMISQNKKGEWTKKYRAMRIYNGKTVDWQINFSFDDIGKSVFLTKEAAEQKLAEMKGE